MNSNLPANQGAQPTPPANLSQSDETETARYQPDQIRVNESATVPAWSSTNQAPIGIYDDTTQPLAQTPFVDPSAETRVEVGKAPNPPKYLGAIPKSLRNYFDGKFEFEGELGRGGMGRAFLAKDSNGDRVVIKILEPVKQGDSRFQRFRREATALTLLDHDNIVAHKAHGVHWHESNGVRQYGIPYIVMAFVEGEPLSNFVAKNRGLEITWTISTFKMLASAIIQCHAKGLIHRDIKPANIMIDKRRDEPLLIDFGLARADRGHFEDSMTAFQQSLTGTGQAVGTPMFMAPEQLFGEKDKMSTAADIWAFGATLYYCLAGRNVFPAATPGDLVDAVKEKSPDPITKFRDDCPKWLEQLTLKCLSRNPEDRPKAKQLYLALSQEKPVDQVDEADYQTTSNAAFTISRRNLFITVASLIFAFFVFTFFFGPRPDFRIRLNPTPKKTEDKLLEIRGQVVGAKIRRESFRIAIYMADLDQNKSNNDRKSFIPVPLSGEFSTVKDLYPGLNRFRVELYGPRGDLLDAKMLVIEKTR